LFLKVKEKVFYGWVVVFASVIFACAIMGVRMSFGVFFKSLASEFEMTRAATSGVFSINMIFGVVFTILGGLALDKYGPRLVFLLMGLFTGLSLLLTSQAGSLWQLYLSYSLLFSVGTAALYPVLMGTVSRWFDKRRGFAMGIASSGVGLGSITFAPFASFLISNFGWRVAYIVMGLVASFLVIFASRLLRNDPSEVGTLPYGAELKTAPAGVQGREEIPQPTGFLLSQALRTKNYWLIAFIWLFWAFGAMLVMTHIIPYATDVGISAMQAATIISVMGGFTVLSGVLVGRISDVLGRKIPAISCALLRLGALIGLIWARELWTFYLFAVAFGISIGGNSAMISTMVVDIFGRRKIGAILGTLSAVFAIGSAIGPFIGGLVYDVNNSYTVAFLIGAGVTLIVVILLALIRLESQGIACED